MRYKQGEDKLQISMLGNSLDEYICDDHICRVIDAFVEKLDMVLLGFKYSEPNQIGQRPYNPKLMLKLYIYGFLNRIRSAQRLEAETLRNIEVMWLLAKLSPDDKTISNFRHDNAKALKSAFRAFCTMINCWGLYGKTTIAVDGTKIRANNSRKKNYNEKNVKKKLEILEKQITEYMNKLEENDISEQSDVKLDETKITEVLKYLNDKKTEFNGYLEQIEANDGKEISTVDADCRLMKKGGNGGMDCCYNAQTAVDSENNLIVASEISQNPNDTKELLPMVDKAKEILESKEITVLADKGYYNPNDILTCEANGTTCYIPKPKSGKQIENEEFRIDKFIYQKESDDYLCPSKNILTKTGNVKKADLNYVVYTNKNACKNCKVLDNCTKSKAGFRSVQRSGLQDEMDIIDARFKENFDIYKKRQAIVEHPYGTIKRGWGFDHFLCKGKDLVGAENALACLAYNLRRIINIWGAKRLINELI